MAKKRKYGSGGLSYRRDKKLWVGQLSRKDTYDGSRPSVSAKTKEEAESKLAQLREEMKRKAPPEKAEPPMPAKFTEMNLKQFFIKWEASKQRDWRSKTRKSHHDIIRRHIFESSLAEVMLVDLPGTSIIEDYINDVYNSGKHRDAQYLYTLLRQCLKYAVAKEVLRINPMAAIKKPAVTRSEIVTWNETQQDTFLAYSFPRYDPVLYMSQFTLLTALRQEEVLVLRWIDLDIDNGVGYVNQTLGDKVIEPRAKNGNAGDLFAIPKQAIELLKKNLKMQIQCALEEGWAGRQKSGYVFARHGDGDYCKPRDAYRRYKEIIQEINEDLAEESKLQDIVFHELRHSWATLMRDKGMPIEDIADQLRHADGNYARRTYIHPSIKNIQRIGQFASAALEKSEQAEETRKKLPHGELNEVD